ncbi:MAG TPA: lysophospholipid acyltransferase family protein [Mycobacterium sp.]|nr:lysophospholipid acyltransferase family protein [Mycobacterium sp.]
MTHAWFPRASCDEGCVRAERVPLWRLIFRYLLMGAVLAALPMLFIPQTTQMYCRMLLRCLGVRITKSGGPIRNLPGVLVVSPHISWIDVLVLTALIDGTFVAKAELTHSRGLATVARVMKVIPIDRTSLRGLPTVVDTIAARLRAGQTVVAFPEGTTWCGLAHGSFRPALFQAAIDAGRPVQPLRLSYRRRDGGASTAPAFVGGDTLGRSVLRMLSTPHTVAHVHVEALQLPGEHRAELARRCQAAIGRASAARREHAPAA